MKKIIVLTVFTFLNISVFGQGTFSGDLMMNLNFFQRDSSIKAANNPLYDNYLSGSEGWLNLRYSNNDKGISVFARVDAFNNSNLYNPSQAMTGFGLGAWGATKQFKDLTITAGYIYDQIGSGALFRAYEDRGLLIDNALVGLELKYKLTDNILLKGFTGQQKNVSRTGQASPYYGPIIKGFNAEGDFTIKSKIHILPGIGMLNRTLDAASMASVAATINNQDTGSRFEPMYNMYAFTVYNTLTIGDFSWYAEGAYKTHEAILVNGGLIDKPGNLQFTTIGYAKKGIAINLTGKRTENFVMRTSPNEVLTNGMLNWQPIVARIRPERLMARYTPASQDVSEQAGGIDVLISPKDNLSYTFNYAHINTLDNVALYREIYGEVNYQNNTWVVQGGIQYMQYNQEVYQVKPGVPMIFAFTPFGEITYRFTPKKSLRFEAQYMSTKQDYGSWIFALLEYDIAPKWAISFSDMYNVTPNYAVVAKANNYYNLYVAYTKGPHRFSLAYVKQVDGINCAGGVCRYEPAFSGVKGTVTSSF